MSDYVFTMYRADKFYGPDRQVLANISLSFLPGAKIGVLGPNGAGKSTLLRIMAGTEEPSSGVAELAPGATVGFLEQEPQLDPKKDVRGNVEDGVRSLRDLLDRFNEISAAFAEPAVAGRADEPSRRRVGRVARALPRRLQGHHRRRHARPVLPRQRRRLDPRARPGQGHPVRRQLHLVARTETGATCRGGEDGV